MSEDRTPSAAPARPEQAAPELLGLRSGIGRVTRRTALTGGAAGLAAALLDACGGGADAGQAGVRTAPGDTAGTIFGSERAFRFTIVNHATLSPDFTPTQNGVADACQLLGCSYEWTGSQTGNVAEMVGAINSAISARVDGIATTLVDPTAFNQPVDAALSAHIPVIAYNADAAGNHRLAYVGQDARASGEQLGARIRQLLPGGGTAALFIGAPGAGNVQPRVDGIRSALKRSGIKLELVGSGFSDAAAATTVETYISAHQHYRGFFGCDGANTAAVGAAIQKLGLDTKTVASGGYDLTPDVQQLLEAGYLDFAIDQQPYLQGFFATIELYLYRVSDGLTGAADIDTGSRFVERTTIKPYSTTKSRFEGTGTAPGVVPA